MNDPDKARIKVYSARMLIALANNNTTVEVKVTENEIAAYVANVSPWIEVEARGRTVTVSFDMVQISKRPPLYKNACSVLMTDLFRKEAEVLFKVDDKFTGLNFTFDYIGWDKLSAPTTGEPNE